MAYRTSSATSYTNNNQTATTFAINSPVGVASGDIVVICVFAYTSTINPCSSSGFTSGDSQGGSGPAQGPNYGMTWLYKTAGGSEPGTYTVTINSAPFNTVMAFCAAWSGRNGITPVSFNNKTVAGGTASPVSIGLAGGTAAALDDLIWIAIASGGATCTWTPPSGFTTGLAIQSPTANFGNCYFAYENAVSAGATGTLTGTETGQASDQIGFVISLANGTSVGTATIAWVT